MKHVSTPLSDAGRLTSCSLRLISFVHLNGARICVRDEINMVVLAGSASAFFQVSAKQSRRYCTPRPLNRISHSCTSPAPCLRLTV